jgi:hypothetical protein
VGLKLNGSHQILAYANDVNLLKDKIYSIRKKRKSLIDVSKDVGLEINVEITKHMLLFHHQNEGQNQT